MFNHENNGAIFPNTTTITTLKQECLLFVKICVEDVNSEEVLARIKFPEHDTPTSAMCMMTVSVSTLRVQKFNIRRLHFFKYLILGVHTQPAIHLQKWTRTNKHFNRCQYMLTN
jgi:hypothetical protein